MVLSGYGEWGIHETNATEQMKGVKIEITLGFFIGKLYIFVLIIYIILRDINHPRSVDSITS